MEGIANTFGQIVKKTIYKKTSDFSTFFKKLYLKIEIRSSTIRKNLPQIVFTNCHDVLQKMKYFYSMCVIPLSFVGGIALK